MKFADRVKGRFGETDALYHVAVRECWKTAENSCLSEIGGEGV